MKEEKDPKVIHFHTKEALVNDKLEDVDGPPR